MKKKSLGKNALLNGIRTLLNTLFPLITFPYISRVLSVEGVGKYNFAFSIVQYFLLIAALGISTYAIREGTPIRDNKKAINVFCSEIFTINMCSTAVAYLMLLISVLCIPKFHNYSLAIGIFGVEIFFTTLGTEWIYSIYEEYAYITYRSIVFKIISIILLFMLVNREDDYLRYVGITVFANVGSNILNFIHVKKFCSFKITKTVNWKKHFTPIMVIFASTVATTVYINSDTTMLGLLTSDYNVGIYSVSSKIYRIIKQLLASVLIVSIPRLSMLSGQKRDDEYRKLLTNVFNTITILALPSVVGLFCLSEDIVAIISGPDYVNATTSLQLLSIALIFCLFGWIYNQCVLIPAKRERIVFWATMISAVINIILNVFLIPIWKENAVALTTVIAEAIMMVICIYYGRKITKLNNGVIKNIITVLSGCIGIGVVCKLVKQFELSSPLTVIVAMLLSVIAYCLILLVTKNKLFISLLKLIVDHHGRE